MWDKREIKKQIQAIEQELTGEFKKSDVVYTTMGDGWHENAAWEDLRVRVGVLQARLVQLQELLKDKEKQNL